MQVPGGFAASLGLFEAITRDLDGPETAGMTHAQLEDELTGRGRELIRQLYQDHLDLRAVREVRAAAVVDTDGLERTRIERGRARTISTIFGKVVARRFAYRGEKLADLHPADAALNLPAGMHSHGLARLCAIEAARGSFADACERVNAHTGAGVGKRQVGELVIEAACDIDAFYAAKIPAPATSGTLLVLTVDGKGIVIRPEALREATAKLAAAATKKYATRLAVGEKNGRKRMATLGAVYDAEPAVRTIDDIIAPPGRDQRHRTRNPGPLARAKWLTGSVEHTAPHTVTAVFDQAESRDRAHARTWVVLVDGAPGPIELIKAEARTRGVQVNIVIDFIHVLEYLWDAAWCLYENGDPDAEPWVAGHARKLLAGRTRQVIAQLETQAAGLPPARRKGLEAAVRYLTGRAPQLRYDKVLKAGWPIATGVIEGACRHLVKDRMDITGARWGLDGAEAVLKLRAMRANGDFDAYWHFHQRQDHQRNHQAKYRELAYHDP